MTSPPAPVLPGEESNLSSFGEDQDSDIINDNIITNPFTPQQGRIDNPQDFFNREREIRQIFEVLNSGSSVALIGAEGVGKSSLLSQICQLADTHLHSPRQPVFLDLNTVVDEDDFYGALCNEIGIPESKGTRLIRHLKSRQVLLALDNVGKMTWDGFNRGMRDFLRGLAEGSQAPLKLVLAANESLDKLFNDSWDNGKTSPLAGVCQEEVIKPWDEPTARDFIETRLAMTSIRFTEAFAVVRSLLYGEELFTLAQTLTTFSDAKEPATIATLELPTSPNEPLLRPITWNTINSLCRVVEDVRVVQRSVSRSTRAFALTRTLGELETILNHIETLPEAERELIKDIAQTWQDALLQIAAEIGEISITKPVTNPYVVGDPVEGNRFVGRDDILRQLEELWVMSQQLQSVVLYGHRRMGKTSILLNVANCSGSRVKVVYINLLRLGSPQGVGEVLMAISDAISDAIGCPPPDDDALLNLPYRTFERYFKQVVEIVQGTETETRHGTSLQGLIIALDEFEKIEELIEAGKIPNDFIGYLRGLVQMNGDILLH